MHTKQVFVMWTAAVLFALATYQLAMAQLPAQPRRLNLGRLLQQIERHALQAEQGCQQGNQQSCWMAQGWVQAYDMVQQAGDDCQQGDREACQILMQAEQLMRGSLGGGAQGPQYPSPSRLKPGRYPQERGGDDPREPADPGVCQKARQDYERCMSEAREALNATPPRFSSGTSLMATCRGFLDLCR
jgi:hypothetical protein